MAAGQRLLEGKVALVTGASRGIGAGVARELAAQGAKVLLAARTLLPDPGLRWGADGPAIPGSLSDTIATIRSKGGIAEAYQIDLSDTGAIPAMIRHCVDRWGQVDILANCAMGFPNSYTGTLWTTGPDDWSSQFDIGVKAKYLLAHHVCRPMIARGSGLIVNISSAAAQEEYYNPVFRMAMATLDRMTAAIAHDLKPHGVSAVSIWPRWVRTEWVMLAAQSPQPGFTVTEEDLKDSDTPEFTGRAIAHLASDADLLSLSGGVFPVQKLAQKYGFTDIDGRPAGPEDQL